MKKIFAIFVYISLVFLIIALYRADYLVIPSIHNNYVIIVSLLVLFSGFLIDAYAWKNTLGTMGYRTSFKNALISNGLSIFGKYIPGKIWLIAGRSVFIAKKEGFRNDEIITVSVITQIIILWTGLIFGIAGLFFIDTLIVYGLIAIGFWLVLTLILFSKYPHTFFLFLIKKFFKKELNLPFIKFRQVLTVLPWVILRWGMFSLAFYLLIRGLHGSDALLYMGLAYPLAGTLGIAVVIAPGGLGVREGILIAYLTTGLFALEEATAISLASRLWFLAGEVFIFIFALILSKIYNKSSKG